jgi:hypothetical protein
MTTSCPSCGCTASATIHRVVAALREGDVDAALESGLLEAPPCPTCSANCTATWQSVRDARLVALAARERFRAREARLARRQQERDARRAGTRPSPAEANATAPAAAPALPPAAAAALARAKARAAGHTSR